MKDHIKRCAGLSLLVALLAMMNVSAETQSETGCCDRLSALEERLSRVEGSQVSLSQLPDFNALADQLEKMAVMLRPQEKPTTEPPQPSPVCERGMEASEAYVIMTHDSIGKEIRCDAQTDGGGWIVFQRRETGDVDFYKTWAEYRDGFGSLEGDFWLGNEALYTLTNEDAYELRIDVRFKDGDFFAYYNKIKVESEADKYRLGLGEYSGTVGDVGGSGMIHSNNGQFSTHDQDNDRYGNLNCAETYHGAWWYTTCSAVNLNGEWGIEHPRGMRWYNGQQHRYATFTEMKIRKIVV